jgi:uncharacterized protein (DUF305 family)
MKTKLIFTVLAALALAVLGANNALAQNAKMTGNQTDLQFLDMMLMHHSDGVKMAQMGVDKAQNAGVKALAEKMKTGQQKDIEEMEKMREEHFSGQPKAETMTVKKQKMTMEMMMKMAEEDMKKLEAASGAEFDRAFLDVFMKHHQMAIDMSKEETGKGKDAAVKKKAREIISVQTKEMGEMKRLKTQVAAKTARSGK